MRVYKRKEFLQLPTGTIFCKGIEWFFDNLSVKGHSWDNDFLYVDLCNIDSNDVGQWADRLEDSLKNGTSYQINNSTAHDGLFIEDEIFLVFERKDLEYLINIMKIAIKVVHYKQ